MGILHKTKYRIRYNHDLKDYDVHVDYGLLLRDWCFLNSFLSESEARQYIESQVQNKEPKYTDIAYL
jgi:hypothetical protein